MYANLSGRPAPAAHRAPAERTALVLRWRPLPVVRLARVARDGGLELARCPPAASVPAEGFEPAVAARTVFSGRPTLRRAADSEGRTVVLVYAPRGPSPGETEAGVEIRLLSMLHLGDQLRLSARRLGLTGLAARICAALVEGGSLRRAALASGVSYLTARSEIRDAMDHIGAACQSALVHRLAEPWLDDRLDGERATSLLASTFGLSPRDARTASLRAAGLSRAQAAAQMGVSRWAMDESCARVHAILGVHKAPQLTRLVVDLLLAADLAGLAGRQGESA